MELATDRLTPEELYRDYYSEDEVKTMGGQGIFTWLKERPEYITPELWNKFCQCQSKGMRGWGYDEAGNWWFHIGCGKPRPHFGLILNCDCCGEWYRPTRTPDRNLMCEDCVANNE